jgi:hypothetical protein
LSWLVRTMRTFVIFLRSLCGRGNKLIERLGPAKHKERELAPP